MLASVKGQKLSEEEVINHIFRDITFCTSLTTQQLIIDIPKGNATHPKAELEALVHKHGGDFSQAQLSDLSAYVIAPDVKSGHWPVVVKGIDIRSTGQSPNTEGRIYYQTRMDL